MKPLHGYQYSFLLFVLTGLSISPLQAQDFQLYGSIPSMILNGELREDWSYNFTLSSETNMINRTYDGRSFPAEVSNINLEGAIAHNVNPNVHLAGGFLYRFQRPFSSGPGRELRPWQQLTLISRVRSVRIRNRLRLEERIRQQGYQSRAYDLDVRLRYRLSSDFPLEGERLDDGEFYLNLSSEALFTLTVKGVLPYWESRNYVGLGYRFNRRHRLEPALDFRIRRRNAADDRQRILFLRIQWIYKILRPGN